MQDIARLGPTHRIEGVDDDAITDIRERVNDLYHQLTLLPANRHNSLAKTALEECCMWAVKGCFELNDE